MVDRETLSRKCAALVDYTEKLKRLRQTPEVEYIAEDFVHDLAERYLHLASECMLDIANHIIADQNYRTPETNADTFRVLLEAGEISAEQEKRWTGWAGLRNVLVHLYLRIDHAITYSVLQNELSDLDDFVAWAQRKLP